MHLSEFLKYSRIFRRNKDGRIYSPFLRAHHNVKTEDLFPTNNIPRDFYKLPSEYRLGACLLAYIWEHHPSLAISRGIVRVPSGLYDYLSDREPWTSIMKCFSALDFREHKDA